MQEVPRNLRFYKPSGAFSRGGVVLTLILGAVVLIPSAFVYALAVCYTPADFFFAVFLGMAMWQIVNFGVNRCGIRNVKAVATIGFLLFLLAYAAHWPVYVAARLIDAQGGAINPQWVAQTAWGFLKRPDTFLTLIPEIIAADRGGPCGIMPLAAWFAEAMLWLYFAVSLPLRPLRHHPYSERTHQRIQAVDLMAPIPYIADRTAFLEAISRRDYSALLTPKPKSAGRDQRFATVSLYPDDRETYITVTNVSPRHVKKSKKVVELLAVDNAIAREIRSRLASEDKVAEHAERIALR